MAADLAIIIVGWNARDWLLRCLASLPAGAAGLDVETWVVDNASTDGTVEAVARAFPQVHLIANTANLGFAAANNQAAGQTDSRYLLLL
ncbi:MAG: glycosyltransferase, partial [Anaerolineae bacterium]